MSGNTFYRPSASPPGVWGNFWLPLLVSVVLFLIDFYLIPGIFALPLLLLILLIFLAFRLTARMVALWTVIYALVILAMLFLPIPNSTSDPALKPYIRTAVFLTGGSGAILLAAYRHRLAQQVLKNHVNEQTGHSYFSIFAGPNGQDKTAYLDYFDPHHVSTVAILLRTRTAPTLSLHAAITVVTIGNHRYAITVVESVEVVAPA
jgi:hypothetical protein